MEKEDPKVRVKLLKFMYAASVPIAGVPGIMQLVAPEKMVSGAYDPVTMGIAGSATLAFGILAVLGFRSPMKFIPILMMQVIYKSIWLAVIGIPLMVKGALPPESIGMAAIFVLVIIGNLFAIPFRLIFSR